MKLYNSNFSSSAKRARICAAELGIKLELVNLDMGKGENRTAEYLAKNPMGKICTLEDEGFVLWESPAILVYLASKTPEKALLPTDPPGLANAMRWMFWNASHLEVAANSAARERIIKPQFYNQPSDQKLLEIAEKEWARYAPVLNAQLEGKSFVLGERFSIVDIALGCTVEHAQRGGLDLQAYPHLRTWLERLAARDAWKNA